MSTLSALVTQVRDELSEPTAGFWSDAEIKRWLNRANYDLADAAGVEASSSQSITTADGTESYSLASGFGLIEQVERVDTSDTNAFYPLEPMTVEQRQDGKGEPVGFYVFADSLYIVPKPDGVYTIRVWYYKAGVTLSADGDTPIIPSKYHDALALYAIAMAKRKAEDPSFATYLNDYVSLREDMISFLRKKGQGNRFSTIEDVDER